MKTMFGGFSPMPPENQAIVFITEPIPKYGKIRCYIRDPDGYIIEVGQSTGLCYS